MRSAREEIKGFYRLDLVFFEKEFNVASLGRGIAGQINNFDGFDFQEFVN